MSQFFDDLEAQLRAAARAQTEDRSPGAERSSSKNSRLRSWGGALPVALGVAVTAAVVVVALTVHSSGAPNAPAKSAAAGGSEPKLPPAGASLETIPLGASTGGMQVVGSLGHVTTQQQRELTKYVFPAQIKASKAAACQPPSAKPTVSEASPTGALLSALGVLRRPATGSDVPRLPGVAQPAYPIEARDIYIRYVRRARVKAGISYYVIPAARLLADPQFSASCRAEEVAVLRGELRRIPAGERASTITLQARWLALFAHADRPAEAVCLSAFARSGGGGGTCVTAADTEQGSLEESNGSTFSGVVPDGIASVAVHYPAGNGAAAITVTSNVVGNVFAVRVRGLTLGGGPPPSIVWRSATGRIVKTISTR